MSSLNARQREAVESNGNVVVTACPGSGKTRVLTARVLRAVEAFTSPRDRVVALTFTNRAADEVRARILKTGSDCQNLWTGTIHAFSLHWILRPYAPYVLECRHGFTVADEVLSSKLLDEAREGTSLDPYYSIDTGFTRSGQLRENNDTAIGVVRAYKQKLRESHLIDYEDILFFSYKLLRENREIASTIGSIVKVFCVDEVQDIQDLQFGIMSEIFKSLENPPQLFFVGDSNQSIFESLGAVSLSPDEIAAEFGLSSVEHRELDGNYRSTQRIVDLCRTIRVGPPVSALGANRAESGRVTYRNRTVGKDELPSVIAEKIEEALGEGIPACEICVVAPRWMLVRSIAKALVALLPNVPFDAPGLSPLHSCRNSLWFTASRLALVDPGPTSSRSRFVWAREFMEELENTASLPLPEFADTPRRFLRVFNSLESTRSEGVPFLEDIFNQLICALGWDLEECIELKETLTRFLDAATNRIDQFPDEVPSDVQGFRRLFQSKSGVVVNTCHGVKGEEYETVVAVGLLRGYVPHWDIIINGTTREASESESKLLYVTASRAKRNLHLFSETGRLTKSQAEYRTSPLLNAIRFSFD